MEPHVFNSSKSLGFAPASTMSYKFTVVVPEFFRLMLCTGLVVPCAVVAKVRAVGLIVTVSCAVPAPLRATDCALVLALDETLRVATREPVVAGSKATSTVHIAEAAIVVPQAFRSRNDEELVPVREMLLRVTVEVPVLVRVTFWAVVVVPTSTEPKERLEGETMRVLAAIPVPLRVTF